MKRAFTAGVVFLVSAVMAGGAFASNSFKGRADLQSALTGIGASATSAVRTTKNHNGRVDLAYSSNISLQKLVQNAKQAYRTGKKLPGKYQLVGLAKLDRRGSWSFTFDRGGYYSIAEVWPSGSGTKVTIWGLTHKVHRKTPPTHPPTINR